MSGWIKYEKDLETDPRFLRMLHKLNVASDLPYAACVTTLCGALARFWAYADTHVRADDRLELGVAEIDGLLGVPGFCVAMPEDWLTILDDATVELPNYQRHNGVEARKRALDQKRQEAKRRRDRTTSNVTDVTQQRDKSVTGTRLDQTRPDKTRPPLRSSSVGDLSPVLSGGLQGGESDVLKKREEKRRAVEALVMNLAGEKRWA